MKRFCMVFPLFFTIFLFLFFPLASLQGAKNGLMLWFEQVLPSLLPLIIFVNLLLSLNLHHMLSRIVYPILHPLFSFGPSGCFALLIGFLSGLPLGAKTISLLYENNELSRRDALLLLSLCNNPSPMFLISYVALSQLRLQQPYLILILVQLSSLLTFLTLKLLFFLHPPKEYHTVSPVPYDKKKESTLTLALFDSCIMNGFKTITKIGGYLMLSCMYASILPACLPFSGTSLPGLLLVCIPEMTSGIAAICSAAKEAPLTLLLVIGCACFSGLSGLLQAKSELCRELLPFSFLFFLKLLQCFFGVMLAGLFLQYINYC